MPQRLAFEELGNNAMNEPGGSSLLPADEFVADSSTNRVRIDVPARVPLVGRLAELRALHDAYRLVQNGSAEVIGIRGEAGIGKTRLVKAFADDLRVSHMPVFATRCSEQLTVPLLPMFRLLQRAARDPTVPAETRQRCQAATKTLRPDSALKVPAERAHLFMGLTELLVAVTSGRPTVIIVDDIQWADAVTRGFLEFFATELVDDPSQTRTLLLLTQRTSFEPQREPTACCDRLASWIELGPLDGGALRMLLRHLGIENPSPRLVGDLWATTKGNTLHLIETVRQLAASNAFVERSGVINTSQMVRASVPADLSSTVGRQMDRLPERTLELLTGFAILGDEAELGVLARMFGLGTDVVQERLGPAIDDGVLERTGLVITFIHPLFRQVLELRAPDSVRTKLHDLAVQAIIGASGGDPESLALATAPHIVAAGPALTLSNEERAELLTTAARQSSARAGWDDAHRYYLAALSTEGTHLERRGWLHYEAGRSAELDFDWYLADRHFQAATECAEEDDDPELGAWATISRLHAKTVAGQPPRFHDELDTRAIEQFIDRLGPEHGTAQVVVRTQFSQSLSSAGELTKARRYADEALHLADELDDEATRVKAEMTAGLATSFQLDVSTALQHYRRGQVIANKIGDDLRSGHGLTRIALLQLMIGDLNGATLTASDARPVNMQNKQWSDLALLAGVQAQVCLLRGDFVGVESWSREGEYYIELSDYPFAPGVLYPVLATARALQGEASAAARAIDKWSDRSGRSHPTLSAAVRRWSGQNDASHQPASAPLRPTLPNLARLLLEAEEVLEARSASRFTELIAEIPDDHVLFAPGSITSLPRARARWAQMKGSLNEALEHARLAVAKSATNGALLEHSLALLDVARLKWEQSTEGALGDVTTSWRIAERLGSTPVASLARELANEIDPTYELTDGETSQSYRVVMFVDMVGSVAISVRSDQLYIDLVDHQFAIVRRRIAEFGGTEFGTSGDAVLAWFESIPRAVRCAIGIHADVRISPQPRRDAALRVKVGIAAGKLLERDGYLYGRVVNLAARLSDQAGSGQTVLTADLQGDLPNDSSARGIGPTALKGFDQPLNLISVDST